jgi:hypothetical protein
MHQNKHYNSYENHYCKRCCQFTHKWILTLSTFMVDKSALTSSIKIQQDGWMGYVYNSTLCFLYEMLLPQDNGLGNAIFFL